MGQGTCTVECRDKTGAGSDPTLSLLDIERHGYGLWGTKKCA